MKKLIVLSVALIAFCAWSSPLQLTWLQPPGYTSTLYSSTNLAGAWSDLGQVDPPVNVEPTNQVTFFYIAVAPTNPPSVDIPNGGFLYTSNPNDDGIVPTYPNKTAYAYATGGILPTYLWNPTSHIWE